MAWLHLWLGVDHPPISHMNVQAHHRLQTCSSSSLLIPRFAAQPHIWLDMVFPTEILSRAVHALAGDDRHGDGRGRARLRGQRYPLSPTP